jgi:Xaa-Pro aminopeptidase
VTRTLVVGTATARQRGVHRAVCEALEAAIDQLRPGVEARRPDEAARECLTRAGLGEGLQHGTGHGLGLEVHERPRLHRDEDPLLRPGMVVTVEPGLYFPGWGGVRVEDDYWVAQGGAECLTPHPRDLLEL